MTASKTAAEPKIAVLFIFASPTEFLRLIETAPCLSEIGPRTNDAPLRRIETRRRVSEFIGLTLVTPNKSPTPRILVSVSPTDLKQSYI